MEKLGRSLKAIETKSRLLKFIKKATPSTLDKGNITSIDKQRRTLETKIEEVHYLKIEVLELKLQQGAQADDVREWSSGVEGKLVDFE